MNKKPGTSKDAADKLVKGIRRKPILLTKTPREAANFDAFTRFRSSPSQGRFS